MTGAAERDEWVRIADAVRLLVSAGLSLRQSQEAIIGRLAGGMLQARAARALTDLVGIRRSHEAFEVPPDMWSLAALEGDDHFWTIGDVFLNDPIGRGLGPGKRTHSRWTHPFDVHVCHAGLRAMLRTTPSEARSQASVPTGRPPAEFWEDLLIAMFQRINEEGWQPRTQAELVRAMHDWLAARGLSAGDSSLKARARRLLAALELGRRW